MQKFDVVVIGGSAAGIPAAVTARRHYADKSITLIRKEERALVPCGIPYIFGTVGAPEKNLMPDEVYEKNGINLIIDEAVAIDPETRVVSLESGEEVQYDKLVLATGSLPVVPPVPGFDKDNVFAILKEVPYLTHVQEVLKTATDLVVVGGGFIGVEFADECNKLGHLNVTIVELLPSCLMLAYDEEFCVAAEDQLRARGVKVMTGRKVAAVLGDGKVAGVKLDNDEELPADAVIIGIGASADVELAKTAGLRIGPGRGIAVDRTQRTPDRNIFAVGDCADKQSFFGGGPCPLKLASIATQEARIAGANLFGLRRDNIGAIGVYGTAIGDTALATAGLTERLATEAGYDVVTGAAEAPNRHPGGMPGMAMLKVKLVIERKTGVILGGQAMGDAVAGEVINTVGACIAKKMTADDIATFQMGTHPALTASPIVYQLVNAAESAIGAM